MGRGKHNIVLHFFHKVAVNVVRVDYKENCFCIETCKYESLVWMMKIPCASEYYFILSVLEYSGNLEYEIKRFYVFYNPVSL